MPADDSETGYRRVPVGGAGSYWEREGSLAPFTRPFMLRHTRVPSLVTLVDRAGLLGDGRGVDEVLASPEWDRYVRQHTPFKDWAEMRAAAEREQTARELLKNI